MKARSTPKRRINAKAARFRLRVGRSKLHRYGVFALEDIPRDRRVIEYTGKRVTVEQAARIRPPADIYIAWISGNGWWTAGAAVAARVHEPFVPAQFAAAARRRPPTTLQPPEDPHRRRTDLELPLSDQAEAHSVPLWRARVPRDAAAPIKLTMPARSVPKSAFSGIERLACVEILNGE